MTLLLTVRSLINERLSAAAEDIFGAVERIVTEIYEDSKQNIEQQRRILEVALNPEPKQHRTDFLLLPIINKVSSEQQERNPSLVHDLKPEQEERNPSLPVQEEPEPVQEEPEPVHEEPEPVQEEPEPVQEEPEPVHEEPEPPEIKEEQGELLQRPEEPDVTLLDGKANKDNLAGKAVITGTTRKRIMDELDSVTVSSLKVARIDEAFLRTLSREDLKDLFPEPEHFLRRRRLWALINSEDENPTLPDKAGPSETGRLSSPSGMPPLCPQESTPFEKRSPKKTLVLQLPRPPEYVLYTDSKLEQTRKRYFEMAAAGREGECVMPKDQRCRLVRNTVVSMISILRASEQGEYVHYPSKQEFDAMAKIIVEYYPMLQDKGKPMKHMSVLAYLIKRCQNVRPPVKKQGPTPKRGHPKKRRHIDFSASDTEEDDDAEASGGSGSTVLLHQTSRSSDDSHGSLDKDCLTTRVRHYKTLHDMYEKSNREARRAFIDSISLEEEDWPTKILDRYPCFKELRNVMEELRRILDEDNNTFVDEVKKRWEDFCTNVQFYGVWKKVMKAPVAKDRVQSTISLFRALPTLFPSPTAAPRKLGHASEALLHVLQPTEDLTVYLQKRSLSSPVLILDGSHCLVAVGSTPITTFAQEDLGEGLLYLLAYYYTLNLTYPKCVKTLLSVIQTEILQDALHEHDGIGTASYKRAMAEWNNYMAE